MAKRFEHILATIGRTPVVRINRLAPPGVNLFAKLEAFNPMASVKDRLALSVIEDAERRGLLRPGQTVIEANADIHSTTTAVEILDDFADTRLDYFVTGLGTGGTLKGVSRVLQDRIVPVSAGRPCIWRVNWRAAKAFSAASPEARPSPVPCRLRPTLLQRHGIDCNRDVATDPYSFLPAWLHPR